MILSSKKDMCRQIMRELFGPVSSSVVDSMTEENCEVLCRKKVEALLGSEAASKFDHIYEQDKVDSIFFEFSKGAATRRQILSVLGDNNCQMHYLESMASEFPISKVALKAHIDKMIYHGYIEQINPGSKPVFLRLSRKGKDVASHYSVLT